VAASLKNRIVPAHVVAKRLVSAGSGNRLTKALTHLGRLIKTTYLLRFFDDSQLRRVVGLQLNRGEFRQKLARHTSFAN
jgi:TnpA family transposase